jgi:single-strand DNA-binding protein
MNRVTLIGFLGADAETKSTNGGDLAILSLATKTSWKNDAGEWESRTEWHRCVAFSGMAAAAANLKKGAHVLVEGELRSREYDREVAVGSEKTAITQRIWEIRIDSILKLDRAAKPDSPPENEPR